ncbi:hypothetical protein CQT46_16580 [Salmonella enterica]|nr:hypothetical protein [Salmonella enterica]
MTYGYGIQPPLPPELQEIDRKAQGASDAIIAIVALLIEDSKNPEETKKRLFALLEKHSNSQNIIYLKRLQYLLK